MSISGEKGLIISIVVFDKGDKVGSYFIFMARDRANCLLLCFCQSFRYCFSSGGETNKLCGEVER